MSDSPAEARVAPKKKSTGRRSGIALKALVRDEVEVQLKKEQEILKESFALAAKIVGVAIAIFLAVFTVFGLTTWSDIKKEAASVISARTDALISSSDAEAGVKQKLSELVNRAVVASALTALARSSEKKVVLPGSDLDRLRSWIRSESLGLQDFKDTLAVLNAQESDRKAQDGAGMLTEMLDPPADSSFKWIKQRPEKREAILEEFKDASLASAATHIVMSSELTESVRSKAVEYVREVGYAEGVERLLEHYAQLKEGDIKRQVLLACIALRPDHPEVIRALQTLLAEPATSHSIQLAIAAIPVLLMIEHYDFNTRADSEASSAVSKLALRFSVDNGAYFTFDYPGSRDPFSRRSSDTPMAPNLLIWRPTSDSGARSESRLSIEQFVGYDVYWELLAELASRNSIAEMISLLPRSSADRWDSFENVIHYSIYLDRAEPGGQISVEKDGVTSSLDISSLSDISLSVSDARNQKALRLAWIDASRKALSADVKEFKGAGFRFSLRERKKAGRP